MSPRPFHYKDRVHLIIAGGTPITALVGTIRRLNVGRQTANVEWDGSNVDKGDPSWRSQLREYPLGSLLLALPTKCPDCRDGILTYDEDAEKIVPNARTNGGEWRRPCAVLFCNTCEYITEV